MLCGAKLPILFSFLFSLFTGKVAAENGEKSEKRREKREKYKKKKPLTRLLLFGRGRRDRTLGTRFWRPLLYQLSYTPIYLDGLEAAGHGVWWAFRDSNPGPTGYEPVALTN